MAIDDTQALFECLESTFTSISSNGNHTSSGAYRVNVKQAQTDCVSFALCWSTFQCMAFNSLALENEGNEYTNTLTLRCPPDKNGNGAQSCCRYGILKIKYNNATKAYPDEIILFCSYPSHGFQDYAFDTIIDNLGDIPIGGGSQDGKECEVESCAIVNNSVFKPNHSFGKKLSYAAMSKIEYRDCFFVENKGYVGSYSSDGGTSDFSLSYFIGNDFKFETGKGETKTIEIKTKTCLYTVEHKDFENIKIKMFYVGMMIVNE